MLINDIPKLTQFAKSVRKVRSIFFWSVDRERVLLFFFEIIVTKKMNINLSLTFLTVLGLSELIFGIWTMTKEVHETLLLPQLFINSPFWFIFKAYLTLSINGILKLYSLIPMGGKCNDFVSVYTWIFIFGHFIWNIVGFETFWKCQNETTDNNIHNILRIALWIDILLGMLLLVFNIKLFFTIHQLKFRLNYEINSNFSLV
jgi:hypothetical protein